MRKRSWGFTIVEVLIASAMTISLMAVGYVILTSFGQVFKKVDGNTDATLQMKKATRNLGRDLKISYFNATRIQTVPGNGGLEGDALCMLTASSGVDARGLAATDDDGAPFWQRNVLYYTTRPLGDACSAAADPDGYEDVCPHKVLIRKIIDTPPTTNPMPPGIPSSDEEILLTSLTPYLTRPNGMDCSAMLTAEPFLKNVEVISVNLLSMRVAKTPNPIYPGEIEITLTGFNESESRKFTNLGSVHLGQHENVLTQMFSVFPRNNQ